MSKEGRVINGLKRIVNVAACGFFIVGAAVIYSLNTPKESYVRDDSFGNLLIVPATGFDFSNFFIHTLLWGIVVFILYLVLIYILNGFRSVDSGKNEK